MRHQPAASLGGTFALTAAALLVASACDTVNPPVRNPDIAPATLTGPGWAVTRRYSAHHALIVEVECRSREDAVDIAKAIVEPIKDAYVEALIYVRPKGANTTRRVQWLRRDGKYRTLDF